MSVFSAQTARESINIIYKGLDNRIIDLNAALHVYTENLHWLEQCILSEVWPKTFPHGFDRVSGESKCVLTSLPTRNSLNCKKAAANCNS